MMGVNPNENTDGSSAVQPSQTRYHQYVLAGSPRLTFHVHFLHVASSHGIS